MAKRKTAKKKLPEEFPELNAGEQTTFIEDQFDDDLEKLHAKFTKAKKQKKDWSEKVKDLEEEILHHMHESDTQEYVTKSKKKLEMSATGYKLKEKNYKDPKVKGD